MKKVSAILLALIIGKTYAFQNEPDGFRGILWASDFEENKKELVFSDDMNNDTILYSRNNDKNEIGGSTLTNLYYEYYKNKFSGVFIITNGYDNNVALVEAFKSQFGKPVKPNRYLDIYLWRGENTQITLKCIKLQKECNALIESTLISNLKKSDIKQKANSASQDF